MASEKGLRALPIICSRLHEKYPNATYELNWSTPLELLIGTILAAQATDKLVNQVTAPLFKKYRSARDWAEADTAELEEAIKPTGYYHNKAKAIQGACQALLDHHNGQVPRTMDEMLALPGVARKTANVVLNTAFGIPSGIIVDTHVERVSKRLGLTKQKTPEKIEKELMQHLPQHEWTSWGPAMVLHGRYTCTAVDPKCPECVLNDVCEKVGVGTDEGEYAAAEAGDVPAGSFRVAASAPSKSSRGRGQPAGGGSGHGGGDGDVLPPLPASWQRVVGDEMHKPYFAKLVKFLEEETRKHKVFPPRDQIFSALELTPYENVNVLLLGQDPYHDDGQAHGLCFSVQPGVPPPPSLVNMYKELHDDLGCRIPNNGYLVPWAEQGVLMLNAVLTVRAHEANSHKNKGWEQFTDAIISKVSDKADPVVFVLWGGYAQKKAKLIDTDRHTIIQCAHPSPLSARSGFFGSKCFSAINAALRDAGKPEIDWQIPNI
jgi:uracil-DNA glycosylase